MALIRVVLTVAILFWLSWRLAIAALIAMPPIALASFLWMRKVRPVYRSIREDRSEIDGRVNETFGGIRVVRALPPRAARGTRLRDRPSHHHPQGRSSPNASNCCSATSGACMIPATSLLIVWYGG